VLNKLSRFPCKFFPRSTYFFSGDYLVYAVHGMQAPPVSKEVALPDCVALSVPLDEFVEKHYKKCFDF
ncbi:MAG: hypothetical protein KDK65_06105, partial [Chlamydiia bacterium]|nr:hypothetical protein [Chlamydiia bacterium]